MTDRHVAEAALDGLKVIDLSRYGPGLVAAMVLGDLGADVIHVEEPAASLPAHRRVAVDAAGRSERELPEYAPNRNKRSIVLDLKQEAARAVVLRLAAGADVVLEGFRPGVAERLGVDHATLGAHNPSLVYCSITGYGQAGPYAARPGHDLNYAAFSGILARTRGSDSAPVLPGVQVADFAGGALHALVGVLAALLRRDRTGAGQYLDAAMADGLLLTMANVFPRYFAGLEDGGSSPGHLTGAAPFYNVYETRDGRWLTLGCNEPALWRMLCERIGRPDLVAAQGEPERWPRTISELQETFAAADLAEWERRLADVAFFAVREPAEVPDDPHARARGMFVDCVAGDRTVRHVAPTLRLSETPGSVRSLAPRRGEHTTAILREAGYSEAEIAALLAAGTAVEAPCGERGGATREANRHPA